MLKDAHVNVKIAGELKNVTVGEVYDMWMQHKQKGGPNNVEIECYQPIQRRFSFKPVRKFTKYNQNRRVVKLVLKTDKTVENSTEPLNCEIILSEFSKILVKVNGTPTLIPVSALLAWKHGKASIGFVCKDGEKCEIKYYAIIKVSDPLEDIAKANDEVKKHNAELQVQINESKQPKRGRKPKIEVKELIKEPVYEAVIAETGDGSFFVCDNVICN